MKADELAIQTLAFLFPLTYSLDCHKHGMGSGDGPRRKLTVQHPAEEAAVPRQYSRVKGISRSHVRKLGSGCTSYFQRCLSHLNIFEKLKYLVFKN